ncbi:hypothetical protein GSI_07879 [Ganoderma sinense ZZ0214-1]|uniref:Uncharacterized protein n=1 Tax=Ganoderma sinense ZZ0214-1 TaxID=1077348 RepID=A0A2G8S8W0_9APHY|nr:hypothetical protein GSI_07879 [Ganoderma sinense ZZ0214-1]
MVVKGSSYALLRAQRKLAEQKQETLHNRPIRVGSTAFSPYHPDESSTVHEFGTPAYTQLVPPHKRLSGSRAAIVVDVHKVGSVRLPSIIFPRPSRVLTPTLTFILVIFVGRQSCGYAVPLCTFQAHRTALFNWSEKMEARDAVPSSLSPSDSQEPPERSMKWWWVHWNLRSLDDLPALSHAHIADAVPRTGEDARAR